MLTEDEKRLLTAYKDQIRAAVKNLAGAIKIEDMQTMAAIWRREKDKGYNFRPWCRFCKMDLLRKMNTLLDEL